MKVTLLQQYEGVPSGTTVNYRQTHAESLVRLGIARYANVDERSPLRLVDPSMSQAEIQSIIDLGGTVQFLQGRYFHPLVNDAVFSITKSHTELKLDAGAHVGIQDGQIAEAGTNARVIQAVDSALTGIAITGQGIVDGNVAGQDDDTWFSGNRSAILIGSQVHSEIYICGITVQNAIDDGVFVGGTAATNTSTVRVTCVTSQNNGEGILLIFCENAIVSDCLVDGTTEQDGIETSGCDQFLYRGNIIRDVNSGAGIDIFGGSTEGIVTHNMSINCPNGCTYGGGVGAADNLMIIDNRFDDANGVVEVAQGGPHTNITTSGNVVG